MNASRILTSPNAWTDRLLRSRTLAVAVAAMLTAVSAQVAIPIPGTPVPVTLQTLAVVAAGVLLGPWLGASAQVLYVALGVLGAPVFAAGGGGLPWLFGPTGGYLLAFPLAAALAGVIAGRARPGRLRAATALAVGTGAILVGGASQLVAVGSMTVAAAWALGVAPFLPGAVLKVAAGVWVVRALHPRRGDALP